MNPQHRAAAKIQAENDLQFPERHAAPQARGVSSDRLGSLEVIHAAVQQSVHPIVTWRPRELGVN